MQRNPHYLFCQVQTHFLKTRNPIARLRLRQRLAYQLRLQQRLRVEAFPVLLVVVVAAMAQQPRQASLPQCGREIEERGGRVPRNPARRQPRMGE